MVANILETCLEDEWRSICACVPSPMGFTNLKPLDEAPLICFYFLVLLNVYHERNVEQIVNP